MISLSFERIPELDFSRKVLCAFVRGKSSAFFVRGREDNP
jgi:hypothetical protein